MPFKSSPVIAALALLLMTGGGSEALPPDPGAASPANLANLASPASPARPNIIIILADDLGWGDVSANGAELIRTPHIDRIAREGISLTSFYSAANVCTPARAALLTGRYAIRSGMQHVIHPQSTDGLPEAEITLAELASAEGYVTHMVGKWHLGHSVRTWPTNHGFDSFFGVAYSNDMQPFDLYRGQTVIESPADQARLSSRYSEDAAAFIRDNKDQPFLLYYAETAPHLPLFTPGETAGTSEGGLYGDVVEELDRGVGRILGALDETGLAANTLVIFTSDNGPWFEGSAGTFRGEKGGTHEGAYRVPMLARLPGVIPPGAESGEAAMSIDLLPTIAALIGSELPADRVIDGRDLAPVLRGQAAGEGRHLFFFNGNDIVAVRNERFKLLVHDYYRTYYVPFEQFSNLMLFDYDKDPATTISFARENPQVVAELQAALAAFRAEVEPLKTEALNPFAAVDRDRRIGPDLEPD
ncbi:MAG: sulfatase [Hyphomonas sp.]|uniref:sulfatase n=1 Tax=Hyphomonas sp. TaxID=87 RepID=UPI0034A0722F